MTQNNTQTFTPLAAVQRALYIGGQWVEPADGEWLDIVNPATEERIGQVPDASVPMVQRALQAARDAQPAWARRSPGERADVLDRIADALERHGEQVAVQASREIGMPLLQSRQVQIGLPVRVLRSTAAIARDFHWERRDASGSTIVREPVGVALAITPWNFPVHQIVAKLAPALASGCTVVVKPAELTPLNALLLASICHEVGVPPGVVNVVTGRGRTTGEALLRSGGYDIVSFTGSLGVGQHVGAVAGGQVVRAALELGGKSPAVVMDDADLETAVRTTVRNCFVNTGQKCNAPSRLLVPQAWRSRAADIAADEASRYVIGDPLDEATTMGPLVSAAQRAKVQGYVDQARQAGARVLGGGVDGFERGFFMRPAIVTDVEASAPIAREEVFGPVLVVLGHGGDEDAVRMANDSEYGLSAELWSGDAGRAAALARRIQAGQVRVNGVRTPALPVSPFGGYKRSGLGREMGEFAFEDYLEIKAILGDPGSDT